MAVAKGILARLIDVKSVMGVFDQRNLQPALHEQRDQLFDQCGFAAAGITGKAENLHGLAIKTNDLNITSGPGDLAGLGRRAGII